MFGTSIALFGFGFALVLPQLSVTENSSGDSLAAAVYKTSFLLYEPVVVEVTLHLEKRFRPNEKDANEADKQLRRLRRRLDVELRDQHNETVRKGLLCGAQFLPTESPAHDFRAAGLAFPQSPDREGGFLHSELTGTFILVVRDRGTGLESNALPIEIAAPTEDARPPSELFKESFPGALMMILERKGDKETLAVFEHLARDYSDTVYGKYASVSLALLRWKDTFRQHNKTGGSEVWGPVTRELEKASTVFEGAHPLRERVLFDLARAQILAGQSSEARRTVEILSRDFPNTEFGRKAKDIPTELTDQ